MSPGRPIAPHSQTQLSVSINGTELRADLASDLLEVRVQLGVRTIGRATITFIDRESDLLGGALAIGRTASLSSVEPTGTLIKGTITALSLDSGLDGTTVTVTVHDDAYLLTQNRATGSFQQLKPGDILRKAIQEGGLTADIDGTLSGGTPLPWALRADSALGLIDEVAVRIASDWGVQDKTLAVWPVSGTAPWAKDLTLALHEELISFSVRQVGTGPTAVTVHGWDPVKKEAVTATATSKTERTGFKPPAGGTEAKVFTARQAASTAGEAQLAAKSIAAAAGRITGRASATFLPTLTPGSTVTIGSAGAADGTYYVREVTHSADAGTLRTSFVVGDLAPTGLVDPWNGPPSSSNMYRSGLTIGVVDALNDPENLGRVRVHLVSLSDDISSAWARVVSVGGAKGRGQVMLPEVGDEVLVAFEDDDLARPVVVGGLFSKNALPGGPPAVDGNEVVSRQIVSRLGHRLELSDGKAPAKQFVELALVDANHRLRIGKDRADLEVGDIPLKITSGGASITFDGRGAITIDAQSLTIKAKQAVKIEGMEVAVKAQTKLDLSGAMVTVAGSASVKVKADGVAEIAGAMVKIN